MIRIVGKYQGMALYWTLLLFLSAMVSCGGTDTNDKAGKTVETLSGKEQVEQMKKMEVEIEKIKEMQAERLKQSE